MIGKLCVVFWAEVGGGKIGGCWAINGSCCWAEGGCMEEELVGNGWAEIGKNERGSGGVGRATVEVLVEAEEGVLHGKESSSSLTCREM